MADRTAELLRAQAENMVRNAMDSAVAGVKAEASIVNRASGLAGSAFARVEKAAKNAGRSRETRRAGVYTLTEEEARARDLTGGRLIVAPDGYIRKTPVQEIKLAADYYQRLGKRVIDIVVLAAAGITVLWLLGRAGVLNV